MTQSKVHFTSTRPCLIINTLFILTDMKEIKPKLLQFNTNFLLSTMHFVYVHYRNLDGVPTKNNRQFSSTWKKRQSENCEFTTQFNSI